MDAFITRLIDRLRFRPAIELDAQCVHTNSAGEVLPPRPANRPIQTRDVDYVEAQLGFAVPKIIRRISTEVADGGFGPNWGIYRLKHPANLPFGPWWQVRMSVESWHKLDHDPREPNEMLDQLPKHFIRYADVGCNITLCVDCTSPEGWLYRDDPMAGEIVPMNVTVQQWLIDWLEQTPWPQEMYGD